MPAYCQDDSFSARIVAWYHQHGRKDLPWQQNASAYRVWISEIMLQQTRVSAVIPYYLKFMQRFPTIESLGSASEDEVLHHWSGLGYYARARNLHKTAKLLVEKFQGRMPDELSALEALPGIGKSTAGAILSLGIGRYGVILDGNVKRVLCRHQQIEGWSGEAKTMQQLWPLAELHTPQQDYHFYNQAMMDLGATLCSRSTPNCECCPVHSDCQSFLSDSVQQYPRPKPKKVLPVRTTNFLLLRNVRGQILLEKRPPVGIWGGLWCFPQTDETCQVDEWLQQHFFNSALHKENQPAFRHTFSHFHLDIHPILIQLSDEIPMNAGGMNQIAEAPDYTWYQPGEAHALGFAAPVQTLLNHFME